MTQQFVPFALPANAPTKVKIESDAPGCVRLKVISGGPVFGWFDRDSADVTQFTRAIATGANANIDFDIAAAAGGDSPAIIRSGGIGLVTLLAEADTRGYLLVDIWEHGKAPA